MCEEVARGEARGRGKSRRAGAKAVVHIRGGLVPGEEDARLRRVSWGASGHQACASHGLLRVFGVGRSASHGDGELSSRAGASEKLAEMQGRHLS